MEQKPKIRNVLKHLGIILLAMVVVGCSYFFIIRKHLFEFEPAPPKNYVIESDIINHRPVSKVAFFISIGADSSIVISWKSFLKDPEIAWTESFMTRKDFKYKSLLQIVLKEKKDTGIRQYIGFRVQEVLWVLDSITIITNENRTGYHSSSSIYNSY